jgi:bifunctional non-homologous end joining protein LigD
MLKLAPDSMPTLDLPFSPTVPAMQAKEVRTLPRGEDWMYEFLWTGERVRAVKRGSGVNVLSRDGKDFTNRFPRIAASVAKLRADQAVIDGEILYLDAYSDDAVRYLSAAADDLSSSRLALLAYDLLCEDGTDLRPFSLLCRRLMLVSCVQGTPIVVSPLVHSPADSAISVAARLGMRGIVAKRGGAAYRPNSLVSDWVKVTLASPSDTAPRFRPRAGGEGATASPFATVVAVR